MNMVEPPSHSLNFISNAVPASPAASSSSIACET